MIRVMKFEREQIGGKNAFTGYGEGYVLLNGARHESSLVVSGERVITDWPVESVRALSGDHVAVILEMAPEIVLLGTGGRLEFPERALLALLQRAGVGVEVMDTPAACRTYNLLLAEGRNVVAALVVT